MVYASFPFGVTSMNGIYLPIGTMIYRTLVRVSPRPQRVKNAAREPTVIVSGYMSFILIWVAGLACK
jgi:hypothetical protein